MKLIPIRQLELLTGIKAHTIRMWELRYKITKPQRSKGNFRHYELDDVELLLNLSLLNRYGFKISNLSLLTQAELEDKIRALKIPGAQSEWMVNKLLISLYSNNIEQFEQILDDFVERYGIDETIRGLVIPFLEKSNILSYSDQSHEVHFAVTAVRKKLIRGIEQVAASKSTVKKALLFLPLGEHYDLILLYITYLLKKEGFVILYLGTNISDDNIKTVVDSKKPQVLVTYITAKRKFQLDGFVQFLNETLPDSNLFITTNKNLLFKKGKEENLIHYSELLNRMKETS